MRSWLGVLGAVSVLVAVSGCGDDENKTNSSSSTGESGVSASKAIRDLTDEERGKLCDWDNGVRGGYGMDFECTDGFSVGTDANQAECVKEMKADLANCAATVREFEACERAYLKGDRCSLDAFASADCRGFAACL